MQKLAFFVDANSLSSVEVPSDYIDVRYLPTAAPKSFTKPVGARFCRLSAGLLFFYRVNAAAGIAVSDVSDGTGSISVPATVQPMLNVDNVGTISVAAPSSCAVSAEWWS